MTERVQILFRLGQVAQDELEDEARAADAFERLLALDKTHLPAARLLESIYERSGTPDRLFNVLRIQRDLTSGPERERILAKMVKVSAEGLADLEASIELYSELFKKNPKSDQAFGALEQALEKAGRWEDLRALLAGKIPQIAEPRELVRLNEKLGVVLYRHLGRAGGGHRAAADRAGAGRPQPERAGDAARHRRAARPPRGAGGGAPSAHPAAREPGGGQGACASGWPRCWAR